jgi:hypothetical protein
VEVQTLVDQVEDQEEVVVLEEAIHLEVLQHKETREVVLGMDIQEEVGMVILQEEVVVLEGLVMVEEVAMVAPGRYTP